jgi:uncharacterized membrane protein YphA (DoxX/SURF4 family)
MIPVKRISDISLEVISFSLIFLFMYAAISKLIDYDKFIVQLSQSPILTGHAKIFSIAVPAMEIAICALLAVHRTRQVALYMSFTLMVMFTSYIVLITKYSDYTPCSCGGILDSLDWTEHLIFNIFFCVLTLIGIIAMPVKSKQINIQSAI